MRYAEERPSRSVHVRACEDVTFDDANEGDLGSVPCLATDAIVLRPVAPH